jgi:hypothetical protein
MKPYGGRSGLKIDGGVNGLGNERRERYAGAPFFIRVSVLVRQYWHGEHRKRCTVFDEFDTTSSSHFF